MLPNLRSTATADRAMGLVVALAHSLSYPLEGLTQDAGFDGLDADGAGRLAKHPAFRQPVNGAVAAKLGLADIALSPAFFTRLGHDLPSRLAVVLLVESRDEVEDAALLLSAGALHRRLLRLTLRSDRERLAAIFGAEAVRIATREAPVLYPRLAELDSDESPAAIFVADGDAAAQKLQAIQYGINLFGRFIAGVDEGLAAIHARRFGAGSIAGSRFSPAVSIQLFRFLQQGKAKWSDLIA